MSENTAQEWPSIQPYLAHFPCEPIFVVIYPFLLVSAKYPGGIEFKHGNLVSVTTALEYTARSTVQAAAPPGAIFLTPFDLTPEMMQRANSSDWFQSVGLVCNACFAHRATHSVCNNGNHLTVCGHCSLDCCKECERESSMTM